MDLILQRGRIDNKISRDAYSVHGSQVEGKEHRTRIGRLKSRSLSVRTGTGRVMLKISRSSSAGRATLLLAGRLVGEWVGELKKACGLARAEHGCVILDFADVVFVDRTGAALVHSLAREGMSLINCSPFITEQLKQRSPDKDFENGKS